MVFLHQLEPISIIAFLLNPVALAIVLVLTPNHHHLAYLVPCSLTAENISDSLFFTKTGFPHSETDVIFEELKRRILLFLHFLALFRH